MSGARWKPHEQPAQLPIRGDHDMSELTSGNRDMRAGGLDELALVR